MKFWIYCIGGTVIGLVGSLIIAIAIISIWQHIWPSIPQIYQMLIQLGCVGLLLNLIGKALLVMAKYENNKD